MYYSAKLFVILLLTETSEVPTQLELSCCDCVIIQVARVVRYSLEGRRKGEKFIAINMTKDLYNTQTV